MESVAFICQYAYTVYIYIYAHAFIISECACWCKLVRVHWDAPAACRGLGVIQSRVLAYAEAGGRGSEGDGTRDGFPDRSSHGRPLCLLLAARDVAGRLTVVVVHQPDTHATPPPGLKPRSGLNTLLLRAAKN